MSLIITLFATWTSVFAIGKATLEHCPPVFLTAARMLFAAFLLLIYLGVKSRKSFKLNKPQIIAILVLSLLNIYLSNVLEFWGLKHLSAGKTCFIYSLSPFFAAFFSYLHFNEKMNPKKWIGMAIGFLGIMPVMYMHSAEEMLSGTFFSFSLAELAIVGAAIFSVYSWVVLRILVKEHNLSPLAANGFSMLIGGLMALFHSFFVDTWQPIPVTAGHLMPFLGGTVLMTMVSNIVCYNLYGYLLKKYTATFMSFMGLLSPVFASLTSWLIIGEKPSLVILGSTAIVGLGLYLVYQAELKQGYILKKKEPIKA